MLSSCVAQLEPVNIIYVCSLLFSAPSETVERLSEEHSTDFTDKEPLYSFLLTAKF